VRTAMTKEKSFIIDAITLLDLIHTKETTGRGPSFHTYAGQVKATIREGKDILASEEQK
jgi:hypothetical protein